MCEACKTMHFGWEFLFRDLISNKRPHIIGSIDATPQAQMKSSHLGAQYQWEKRISRKRRDEYSLRLFQLSQSSLVSFLHFEDCRYLDDSFDIGSVIPTPFLQELIRNCFRQSTYIPESDILTS